MLIFLMGDFGAIILECGRRFWGGGGMDVDKSYQNGLVKELLQVRFIDRFQIGTIVLLFAFALKSFV